MIRDPLTGEVALEGTTREERPNEYLGGPEARCAFCEGNEDLTPPEIARIDGAGGHWLARSFPNKYPAVSPPNGFHEIIVDSPHHEREITPEGVLLWRERYAHAARNLNRFPVLFKNSGAYAGATIRHPHTQLVVLRQRPMRMKAMLENGRAFRERTHACVLCYERDSAASEDRLVHEGADVSMFTRSASRFSVALTVLPNQCVASFDRADPKSLAAITQALVLATDGLRRVREGGVPFNILLLSDPHASAADLHYHFEVLPRHFTMAGFELVTGEFIRTNTAQESAALWRRMIAPPDGSV